ncbi:MAG: hypothetical protein JM58_06190 [Peptococcaceae bacterium BICA1-8]|nr:MAG: hypothetical protein JM58_06190 [Peptococcaceae bacterium BICA1-8]
MDYDFGLLDKAIFVKRDNRFRAEIELNGISFKAYVPNSGRMAELLTPGAKVLLRKAQNPLRKTPYDLLLVEKDGLLICLNSHLANDLFAIWLKKDKLTPFTNSTSFYREKTIGKSRIDFLMEYQHYNYLVEVKSVNLVENGLAKFPDAPTERGTKHLEELSTFKSKGQKSAVVFIIMREDAESFTTHDMMDPLFANTLRKALSLGVEAYAYKCSVTKEGINFAGEVPIALSDG